MIYPQIQRQRRKVEKHIHRAMRLAEDGSLGTGPQRVQQRSCGACSYYHID